MARKRKLYKLTEEDLEVFKAGTLNANAFTDFYLRTPRTGTDYAPGHKRYAEIDAAWRAAGAPFHLWEFEGEDWSAIWGADELPFFRHHHGFRFIPWQLAIHHCKQKLACVCGGFSSGKSLAVVVSALVLAATVEEFKAMLTAPSFFQAKILYQMAVDIMSGTVYEGRFLISAVSAPFPIITIGNSHVGISTLEFRSVSDDGESILSWRGDIAAVDQAELIPDIKQLRKNLGSRLVGKARCGREYMGRMQWVANAGPSPRFWSLYDLGRTQQKKAVAITVTSYDNPHNSEEDLEWLEEEVGGTKEAIAQWMLAQKPIVDGVFFSNATLARCRAKELEKLMADGIKQERMGFVFKEDGTGIYEWFTPYEHGRSYLVVGDPGQANRPDRNSPVIGVFDITEWPNHAYLRGFHWMDGMASITPFLAEFQLLVEKYHAQGQCAFDSTGTQTTLDELVFDFNDLMVEGMNFGQLKMIMLNALRMLMEHGKMRYPYIGGIWDQLGNYKLPDKKLRQDIVSMLMMAAFWLRTNMTEDYGDEEDEEDAVPVGRDDLALADRYASLAR